MFILKGFLSVIGWEALLFIFDLWKMANKKNCYPLFFDAHSNIYREVKNRGDIINEYIEE